MVTRTLDRRIFDQASQDTFAAFSGDRNPIHLDPLAARRTLAGAPIVHGVHGLIWALDRFCDDTKRPVSSIAATFLKMLYLDEPVRLVLQEEDASVARLHLVVRDTVVTRIRIGFGPREAPGGELAAEPFIDPDVPIDQAFSAASRAGGRVPWRSDPHAARRLFPAACAILGVDPVLGLAASSFVVGMVCPGLHSIFDSIEVRLIEPNREPGDPAEPGLSFAVAEAHERFQRLRLAIAGRGLSGSLVAYRRPAPASQPSAASLASKVVAGEFHGISALVVGGSRGLGELVGKLVAAGGGTPTLTFHRGEADARRVAEEIREAGGRCAVGRYDTQGDAAAQLATLGAAHDLAFYFATPPILGKGGSTYDEERLALYCRYYVGGFHALYRALVARSADRARILYPSSIYVDTRPKQMTEYAMAKAAGEILCADLQRYEKRATILVRRLPRLLTDQTSSLTAGDTTDAALLMLSIVRELRDTAA